MTDTLSWQDLASKFTDSAKGPKRGSRLVMHNRIALGEICQFLADSPYGHEFIPVEAWHNGVFMKRRDGSNPTKRLKIECITEDRLEFCFKDEDTRAEQYFFPHPSHENALPRFKKALSEIDWSAPPRNDSAWSASIKSLLGKTYS